MHPNPYPSGLFSHFIKLAVHLENGNPGLELKPGCATLRAIDATAPPAA
jgi:hypothetical protein